MARGGYVLKDCAGQPELIFIATGSEVELAVAAWDKLTAEGVKARVFHAVHRRVIDQGGREAAILSLLEAIETRYPMADLEDPVDVLDESLTGTDPYAAPAAGPAR